MESSWHAVISRIAVTQNQSLKKSVSNARNVKKETSLKGKVKNAAYFTGVIPTLDVTSFLGINRYRGVVQNVKGHLLRKNSKKASRSSAWIVISKKRLKHRKDREIVYFPYLQVRNPNINGLGICRVSLCSGKYDIMIMSGITSKKKMDKA